MTPRIHLLERMRNASVYIEINRMRRLVVWWDDESNLTGDLLSAIDADADGLVEHVCRRDGDPRWLTTTYSRVESTYCRHFVAITYPAHASYGEPMLIEAKWRSKCIWCGYRVEIGDIVEWRPGRKGIAHRSCADEAVVADLAEERKQDAIDWMRPVLREAA